MKRGIYYRGPKTIDALLSWTTENKETGCLEWSRSKLGKGYGQVWNNGVRVLAHRLAYELAFGDIPDGMCVCHACDNMACINPAHLWLGTLADNNRDMETKGHGYYKAGELHPDAKLTEAQVQEIRRLIDAGETQDNIAEMFSVCQQLVSRIKTGKCWSSLNPLRLKKEVASDV